MTSYKGMSNATRHAYDDHEGIIYLADGREVRFDSKRYSSAELAAAKRR